MTRGQKIWNVLVALASGPILAGLILLMPLAVLIGLSVAIDPSLAIDEFVPEEELLLPWILLSGLISAANVRFALIMAQDKKAGRVFEITTDKYADDPSGAQNIHGHPGKRLAEDFIRFLATCEGDEVQAGEPSAEDYGWGFWLGEKGFSPLWVAFAHEGRSKEDEKTDKYLAAVTLEPPILPWRRWVFKPDIPLRDRIERRLVEFLASSGLPYTSEELEEWVDPEPRSQPAPRF
jgi:hypothetical protein